VGVVDLYQRHARAWDAARGTELRDGGWLARFRALLPEAATVLDLGCGTGDPNARWLLGHGCAVTGVDGAPALIDLFRARLPQATALVADMRTLALGRRFDGLLAWDSFFHLTPAEQRAMFPRFAVHADVVLFTSGDAADESTGQFEGEPLYHASLDPAEYRSLLAGIGYDVVAHVADDPASGHHTVWLARRR
jgi:SAM-dependent methyltransferase